MNIYKSYFNEFIKLFPTIQDNIQLKQYKYLQKHYENNLTNEHIEKQKSLYNKYLKLLKNKKLDHYDKVLKQTLELYLDNFKNDLDLMPLEHMDNPIPFFCEDASGNLFYKFNTHQDYYDFFFKTHEFRDYINTCIEKMREGIKKNITLPKVLAEKLLKQIKDIKKTKPYKNNNVPKNLKFNFNIEIEYIMNLLLTDLISFLENEYLNNCRKTFGLCDVKGGNKMYKYLIKFYTSLDLSPLEIHKYGLKEVSRINKEMLKIKDKLGFKGSLDKFNKYLINRKDLNFNSGEEVLKVYRNELKKINNTVVKNQFSEKISHQCIITKVPEFNEKYAAGAYYIAGSIDRSRKGKYYMNLRNLKDLTKMDVRALTLHEANPGHHYQLTNMLDKNHPLFIKSTSLSETAYVEGWALYCENLGEYESLESLYGKLNMEIARALRLVIDTGIHCLGWSIEKSLKFMKKYQFESDNELISHIYRYMAIPGQALSYKLGERVFLKLKKKYVENGNMTIKEFHHKCLRYGNMPLNLLESSFNY